MPTSKPGKARPVVLKFGGSSLADLDKVRAVARVVARRAARQPVVVVVSAMGATTRELLARAEALTDTPTPRELDMLLSTGERASMALVALAIGAQGAAVVSLTGSQCGIITDHRHGNARVLEVRPYRVLDELADGRVVVVGGFSGVSYRRDVTTIGRGGSDTTAVALAAALGADCEIYSDVDGVYSADPSSVPDARRLDAIDADTMLALSRAGARVLHAQAVALAAERGIAIYARRADRRGGQTEIRTNPAHPAPPVRAVATANPVHTVTVRMAGGWATCLPAVGLLGLSFARAHEDTLFALWLPGRTSDPASERAAIAALADAPGVEVTVGPARGLVSIVAPRAEQTPEFFDALAAAGAAVNTRLEAVVTDASTVGAVVPPECTNALAAAVHERVTVPGAACARFPTDPA